MTDIRGLNNLIDEMTGTFPVPMIAPHGSYHKLVKTKDGKLELTVPRDRNGEFEPQVIKKHRSDITEIEDKIIGLYGCGMSTRDISENIQEIYGFEVSAETISNITNRVLIDVKKWQSRALSPRTQWFSWME